MIDTQNDWEKLTAMFCDVHRTSYEPSGCVAEEIVPCGCRLEVLGVVYSQVRVVSSITQGAKLPRVSTHDLC